MSGFFHAAVAEIGPYVSAYGVLALFAIIYFESLGLPLPGESALIAAGVLAAGGELALGPALAAAWLGAVTGDSTGYALGRFGGRALLVRFGPRFLRLSPERLARLEASFRGGTGFWIVLGARFVVVLRQFNGLVAGSAAMPWPRFATANALGAVLWVAAWGAGAYLSAEWIRSPR